ncbi:hypothetical protein IWX90DRAFT_432348 [Phyllosticta citrichinensis]|uniref:Secreted protein n=1 Tax=Phyllosticta citrichinensis TaxID=1130410 RepID=A0ABR1XST1_9PEZI
MVECWGWDRGSFSGSLVHGSWLWLWVGALEYWASCSGSLGSGTLDEISSRSSCKDIILRQAENRHGARRTDGRTGR